MKRTLLYNGFCVLLLLVMGMAPVAAQLRPQTHTGVYAARATELFERVWNYYRVPEYGLFSEYYPQQHQDTLTYMQEQKVTSRKVSFLWPFSGLFSATVTMMQLPGGKQRYRPYLDSVVTALTKYRDTSRSPVGYQAYPPMFEYSDRYYDDNGLAGINYLDAWECTHNPLYLQRAKEAFRFIESGWSDKLGGGITWLEGHDDQKPACSNGMAVLVALKLYSATHEKKYLQKGLRFYEWMYRNLRDTSGVYWNDKKTADGSVNTTCWTYNSGSMLQAAVMLHSFTRDKKYLAEAQAIARGSFRYFGKTNKEGRFVIYDVPWFVLVLYQGYEALYKVDGNDTYINVLIQNTSDVWQKKDRYGLLYKDWNFTQDESTTAKWLLDEACMIEFYARISKLKNEK